ncbi:MAG: WYL domain-containing protein [Oscillospiraceae bacterium]|nr:WYL domain-containing protein [Oscillospiraceae bacterium]
MADNRKRLLAIQKLMKETDEEHPLTAQQIEKQLSSMGIDGARKAILEDVRSLSENWLEIGSAEDAKNGQYLMERPFEDWELKVMADAVSGAKFLTSADTAKLIGKLADMAGKSGKQALLNSVPPVSEVVKTGRKTTKNNIDRLMKAIRTHRQVRFDYYVTGPDGEEQRKYADPQAVHPYALVWREDSYYLIALYNLNRGFSCYRLSRMENVRIIENAPAITLKDAFGHDGPQRLRDFIRQSVYSFHGEARTVTLRAQEKMVDTIIDHFGREINLSNNGDGTVNAMFKVADNRGLYYFLLKYGETIRVLEPEDVRENMKAKLRSILEAYEA